MSLDFLKIPERFAERSQGCLWPWIMQALKPDNTVVTHFNQRMKSPIRSGDDIENSFRQFNVGVLNLSS
jgi:hypothetical protein